MERITAVRLCTFVAAFLFVHDLTGTGTGAAAVPPPRSNNQKPPCAPRCDVAGCPSPSCASGYVPDRCNCCLVCSRAEGDPCGRKNDLPCGDGLECKLSKPPKKNPDAAASAGYNNNNKRRSGAKRLCQCKLGQNKVCGSDGQTYSNVCKMKVVSRKALQKSRAAVTAAHKGPCAPHADTGHRSLLHPNSPRYKFNFIADVVEKIAPAVVHIELFLRHPLFGRHIPLSSGSGFMVSPSGLIVTNAHVVTTATVLTGRPQLRVRLHGGDAYEATVRDVDKKADIATIRVSAQKKFPVLALGRSADLRPGEFVVAIGSPFALQNTVTTGIVSTAQRDGKELGIRDSDIDYVQTDAIINYGNSGGPLVNLDGEVIGINTLKVTAGISFAIPSDRIRRFLTESQSRHSKDKTKLLRGGPYRLPEETQSDAELTGGKRRFIGIRMITMTEALAAELRHQNPDFPDVSSGVLVDQVLPDSPAHRGGIKAGDVIVTLNGQTLRRNEDLQGALLGDQPLLLEVRRGDNDLLFNIYPHVVVD